VGDSIIFVHKKSKGFTLLELVIALTIVAILAIVLVPTFRGRKERLQAKEFVAKLNNLMQTAWQQALISQKIQRVKFDFTNKRIGLAEQKDERNLKDFVPVRGTYADTEFMIPDTYFFRNFYIDGNDQMRFGKRKKAWFFVVPSGLSQSVIINIINQDETAKEGEIEKFGIVLNPFTVQFDYYDVFQRP